MKRKGKQQQQQKKKLEMSKKKKSRNKQTNKQTKNNNTQVAWRANNKPKLDDINNLFLYKYNKFESVIELKTRSKVQIALFSLSLFFFPLNVTFTFKRDPLTDFFFVLVCLRCVSCLTFTDKKKMSFLFFRTINLYFFCSSCFALFSGAYSRLFFSSSKVDSDCFWHGVCSFVFAGLTLFFFLSCVYKGREKKKKKRKKKKKVSSWWNPFCTVVLCGCVYTWQKKKKMDRTRNKW